MNTDKTLIPKITDLTSVEIQKQVYMPMAYSVNESIGAVFNNGHISKMTAKIKVSDLMVDFTYQRMPINAKINKIIKTFDPDLLGVIICSMRENGDVAIIDGSHRYHALTRMNQFDLCINALVYFGLSLQDEAKIFALSNQEHTKPSTVDIFKAGIVAGDEITIAINAILNKNGFYVGVGPGNNKIRALVTLKRIYINAGANILDQTIRIIKAAYGSNSDVMRDQLMSAVAVILYRYKNVDEKRMVQALLKFGNPISLLSNAKAMLPSSSNAITYTSLPYLIVQKYNTKLKSNRLADFPMNLLPQQIWTNLK